jgi:RNA polymerase sigma-70 factor, ECF subfamily
LYDRHAPWLGLRLGRRCGDRGVVDEVVQDTFVAVWRGAARHRREGEVAAWIWGIGIRRLIDRLRRQPSRTRDLAASRVVSTAPSAEEQVLLDVEHSDLGRALGRLSPELRAVVQACVLDGLTTREAARLLAIPPGTVKTRMLRARRRLRGGAGMTTWHIDPDLLAQYARGEVAEAQAFSVEAHLPTCARCRAALGPLADRERHERVWLEVVDALDAGQATWVERLLVRLGVAGHSARLLAATPSLRGSWLAAVAVALGFAGPRRPR